MRARGAGRSAQALLACAARRISYRLDDVAGRLHWETRGRRPSARARAVRSFDADSAEWVGANVDHYGGVSGFSSCTPCLLNVSFVSFFNATVAERASVDLCRKRILAKPAYVSWSLRK